MAGQRLWWVRFAAVVLVLVAGLLCPVGPVSAVALDGADRVRAAKGRVVLTLRAPIGVPATVLLKSGRKKRWVSAEGSDETSRRVTVRLPRGRWTITPSPVTTTVGMYEGSSSKKVVRVQPRRKVGVRVTYQPAPTVRNLQVTDLEPTLVELGWTAPTADAEHRVRMTPGLVPPATVEAGTPVPLTGTDGTTATTATATGLIGDKEYAFSVFARRPGTSKWWGPITTTVATPPTNPQAETATVVTDPATVMITQPADLDPTQVPEGLRVDVPPGRVPVAGQPWVLPHSGALPGGMVGTVDTVAPDGRTVTLVPAGLGEAFDYVDLHVPSFADLLDDTPARAQLDRAARRIDLDCDSGSTPPDVSFTPTFDPYGRFDAEIVKKKLRWRPDIPIGVEFDAEFGIELSLTSSITIEGNLACEAELPDIELGFAIGPVPLRLEVEPTATLTANGAITVTGLGFTARFGAAFDGYVGAGED